MKVCISSRVTLPSLLASILSKIRLWTAITSSKEQGYRI
jgi:hypothetical protein